MSDVVSEALTKARYNEVVHVTVEKDDEVDVLQSSSLQQRICLVPCLNELQGGIHFLNLIDLVKNQVINKAEPGYSDQELILQKELQTKQWFFPMLNDHRRNDLYREAIVAAIHHVTRRDTLNCKSAQISKTSVLNVLDIGSGSGLLSMMAAKYCSSSVPPIPVRVTSVEMSSAFSYMASQTIKENHFTEDMISIQHGQHSMSPLFNQKNPVLFDVCISELFDDGLLGEGWIPSIRDAWKRHLSPHAVVVPSGAQIFASVVQAEWLLNYKGPHPFSFYCLDGSERHVTMALSSNRRSKLIDARHIALPMHAEKLIRDGSLTLLSEAVPVFSFDVSSLAVMPEPGGRTRNIPITLSIPKTSKNENSDLSIVTAHGVLLSWEMNLWDNRFIYSTKPGIEPWQDHWHPCLHIFDHAIIVEHEQTIDVAFRHDDERFFVDLVESPLLYQDMERRKRTKRDCENTSILENSIASPSMISSARAFSLNDSKRLNVFQRSLEYALLSQVHEKVKSKSNASDAIIVLDVSDFALGGLIVASMMARNPLVSLPCKVISLENSTGNLPMITASVAQGCDIGKLEGDVGFEVLQCYNENISLDVIGGSPVHILFSEPYSEVLEGWHLQEALNFYYTVRLLRKNGILSDDTIVLPSCCRLRGCIIESGQLRSAYSRCGGCGSESISGIHHKYVNRVGCRFHEYDLCLPIWQYDYVVLSDPFELGILQYAIPSAPPFPEATTVKASFQLAGQCDALLVWLEYSFAPLSAITFPNHECALVSTNSQSCNQTVRMLDDSARCLINANDLDKYEIVCTSNFGGNRLESHQFSIEINCHD